MAKKDLPKMKSVEMGICYADHTWGTRFIDIPASTPEKDIERISTTGMLNALTAAGVDVAHVFVYNFPTDDEAEWGGN